MRTSSTLLPAGSSETDVDFCERLTKEAGVTLIPVRVLTAPFP